MTAFILKCERIMLVIKIVFDVVVNPKPKLLPGGEVIKRLLTINEKKHYLDLESSDDFPFQSNYHLEKGLGVEQEKYELLD